MHPSSRTRSREPHPIRPTLLGLALLAICSSSPAWSLPGAPFEGADGNLEAEVLPDWETLSGSPSLHVGIDLPTGQADDSLRGKEDDAVPGIDFGSIPSNKSDLLRFYVSHERVGEAGATRDFLYLAWVRADTLGTANMDFEFNQSSQLSSNGKTPVRTPGDMLITFAFASGGNKVVLGLSRWTDLGPCEAGAAAPCWGPLQPLDTVAEGAVNQILDVYDPVAGVTLPALTFGEAMVDLTGAGVFDADACVSFGRAQVRSRSSDSFTASLKDFIEPISVSVTNCANVTIRKNAVPDDPQDFAFVASAPLDPTSFDLDDDGNEGNGLASSRTFSGRYEGTIHVAEQAVASWDLARLDCSGPAQPERDAAGALTGAVTIDALPGDRVECTFTNVKRGRILVVERVVPSGDPQPFQFDLTGGPEAIAESFALAGSDPAHDSGEVRPGTYAIVQQDPGSAWDLTQATCDDGSPAGAVVLDPGETVTCTFVNVKRGRVVIDEVTVPSGDPQVFSFGLTGGPDALSQSFGLTDAAAPHDSGLVRGGTYAATQQSAGSGWDLSSAVCDDGSPVSAIVLSAGETVTCTFTNVKRGRVVIDEVTIPSGDSQVFSFSFTGGPDAVSQSFGLTDVAAPHDSGLVRAGTYAASQQSAGSGWDLSSAVCDDGSPVSAIVLSAGETVTCTFTNVKRGRVLIDEVTIPSGDPKVFSFSFTGGPDAVSQSFGLTDAAAPHDSGPVREGTYAAVQAAPGAEWDLQSATCSDGSPVGAIVLSPGETVTCTFTNVKRGRVLLDEVTIPSGDPKVFSFSFTGGPDAVSQSFGLTDAAVPHDSGLVRAGTYAAVQAAPGAEWDLQSATCSDGSPVGAIVLSAGETVTCTFTNVKRGRIRIDKVTRPSGDPQVFSFTLAGGPDSLALAFGLADATSPYDTGFVRPGTYASAEADPGPDWQLSSSACSDGSAPAAIAVAPGETVTCTFTNTKRGTIVVVKDARPDDPQGFLFALSGPSVAESFTLDDDGVGANSRSYRLLPGSYAVSEQDPGAAWDATGIACSSALGSSASTTSLASRTASVSLAPGDTVTCLFTNTKRGKIVVDKFVVNADIPGSTYDPAAQWFDFSSSYGAPFRLRHLESNTSPLIPAGRSHTVTESPLTGWDVSSVCVYPDGHRTQGGASIQIDLPPGGEVHCTFTNKLTIHPGSSGFWRNWRNHYTDAQFRSILSEAFSGSPVYAGLFARCGGLRADAIQKVDAVYAANASDAQ